MRVRRLRFEDLDWIVAELRALPRQSDYFADVPDDPEYVWSVLDAMWCNGALHGIVDTDTDSFILFSPLRPWYADRIEIHEFIMWVPEQHRGSRAVMYLIPAFIEAAKEFQPHSIHAGATLDIVSSDKVLRLYERFGFVRDKSGVIMRL